MDSESGREVPEVFDPLEVQALHRRLLAAKARGEAPDPDDLALRDRVVASPYALFDRPWAPDDW
jgi:hypothetical protein